MEGLIRNVKEKEAMRLLQQVIKNNKIILDLQKQLVMLEKENAQKKRGNKKESG